MRNLWIVGLALLAVGNAQAQYYLNDIVNATRATEQFTALKQAGIKKVTATSYDADGSITPNFSLSQKVDAPANTLTTYSKSDFTGESTLISQYNQNSRLVQSTENSKTYLSTTAYTYNAQGLLSSLTIESNDSVQAFSIKEQHLYSYLPNGQPTSMLRIKNNTDTLKVIFLPADGGQPGEEQWWQGRKKIATWFYYYDAKNQLTDVARFNTKAQRILPDIIFEYDEDGRLSQQTTVHTGSNSYRIWRYVYDSRDLKMKEGVFNKNKQPEGRIEYSYE